jgi:hypothetical protein
LHNEQGLRGVISKTSFHSVNILLSCGITNIKKTCLSIIPPLQSVIKHAPVNSKFLGVRFEVPTAVVMKTRKKPYDPLNVSRRFGGTCRKQVASRGLLVICFMLVSFLVYPSTLKMKAMCSSETSVDFQRTIGRYIPNDWTRQDSKCVVLIFYPFNSVLTESCKILIHHERSFILLFRAIEYV